jgi:hypothetical protein
MRCRSNLEIHILNIERTMNIQTRTLSTCCGLPQCLAITKRAHYYRSKLVRRVTCVCLSESLVILPITGIITHSMLIAEII